MSENFGLSEGAKGVSHALNSSREASKELSKSIEGIQQDGLDVAQRKANERRRAQASRIGLGHHDAVFARDLATTQATAGRELGLR